MQVLLLNPPLQHKTVARDMAGGLGFEVGNHTILPPLNLALMASILRINGHKVKILDPQVEDLSKRDFLSLIISLEPEVIIGNISLPSLKEDASFLKELKNITGARIIPSTDINFTPILQEILLLTGARVCMLGECELEIEEIIKGKIASGVAFREKERIQLLPCEPVKNLELLPIPARDLLRNDRYLFPFLGAKTTTMQTSRGCPFSCSYYCPYPLIQGEKWRAMSAERVYAELEDIANNLTISNIFFRDACFTLNKERTAQICDLLIKNKLNLTWWCETRINCLDREILFQMKNAGCKGINIGVETGNPQILSSQAKEGVTISSLKSLCEFATRAGLHLHFLLLVGLPQENRNSLYDTFKLVRELKPASLGISVVTPYPGTPLYFDAKERGWIETSDWEKYSGDHAVMHTDKLSSFDITFAQKMLQGSSFLSKRSGFTASISLGMLDQFFRVWSSFGNPK